MPALSRDERATVIRAGALLLAAFGSVHAQIPAPPVGPPVIDTSPRPGTPQTETQPVPHRPGSAQRLVYLFDFEEADNPYPVPRFWAKAQDDKGSPRPGFPSYNEAGFDFEMAASGRASVRLPTRGGSTCLRLNGGVIPVFAAGDYTVTASIRTEGLRHARAFLEASFLDQAQHPIPGAKFRSRPILSERDWTSVAVELPGLFPSAAYLQIDLELLQPDSFAEHPPLGDHGMKGEDISGAAWFDNVTISQAPRVEVTTNSRTNIICGPERPQLRILISDLVGDELTAHLLVRDLDGRPVADVLIPVRAGGGALSWTPELPGLGWYEANLDVLGGGTIVGHAEMEFIWTRESTLKARGAPGAGSLGQERAQFGLIADDVSTMELSLLPEVVERIGTGNVTLSVLDGAGGPQSAQRLSPERFRAVDRLLALDEEITLAVSPLDLVAQKVAPDPPHPVTLSDPESAISLVTLGPVLDRYGQRINRWQVGHAELDPMLSTSDAPARGRHFRDALQSVVPAPIVAVPWSAELAYPRGHGSGDPESVTLLVPASFSPAAAGVMLNDWRKQAPDGSDLTVVPERISAEVFGSGSAVIDFAIRTIEIWRAITGVGTGQSASRLAVDHPWRCNEPYHSQIFPAPELAVWRTLGEHLSGRRIVGEYPLGAGVRCYILAPDAPDSQAGGALVAWNESAAEDVVSARLFLGDKPIVEVDLFGNETPVEQSAEFGAVHTLRVGRSPVFFEGADAMLAQFGASFRLEPAFLVAAAAPHEVAVVLHNPWPRPITGRVQVILSVPGRSRWTVEPRNGSEFSIEAGANRSIPFTITFPAGESAGPKQIAAVVQLNNTPALPPLHFEASAEIGVKDLDLEPDCRFFPGSDGPDVVVTASITNRGQSSRALRLDVSAPGCPLRQAPIADLAPGATIIKRLVYKDAAKSFSGRRIRMSLGDGDQAATLNKTVRVP